LSGVSFGVSLQLVNVKKIIIMTVYLIKLNKGETYIPEQTKIELLGDWVIRKKKGGGKYIDKNEVVLS